jgi:hypothetical protein
MIKIVSWSNWQNGFIRGRRIMKPSDLRKSGTERLKGKNLIEKEIVMALLHLKGKSNSSPGHRRR